VSFFTTIDPWFGSLIALAFGGAILVGIATLLSRCLRQPVWQRIVWQMSMIGLGLLFLGEGSGVVDGAIAWSQQNLTYVRSPSSPSAPKVVQPAESPDDASASSANAPIASNEPFTAVAFPPSDETSLEDRVSIPLLPQAPTLWLGVLWLAGAFGFGSRIVFAQLLLVVLRRRCIAISTGALVERVRKIAQQLGLRRPVRVVESPRLLSPAAFGFFRPTIALPAGFAESHTSEQQDVIVAHELAHLAAHDPAWRVFTDVVTALWWWHPLIWWSRRQLHASMELAADEASLLVSDGPALLAKCLVELGGRMLGERQTGWVRMTGNGFRSGLGCRVKRLLSLKDQSRRPPRRWLLAVSITLGPVFLLSAALFSTAWARPRPSNEGENPMTMRDAWRHSFAGMLLCTALGTNESAAASDGQAKPAASEPARREAKTTPIVGDDDPSEKPGTGKDDTTNSTSKIKVFRLKSADPELVQGVLVGLLCFPDGSSVRFEPSEVNFSSTVDARTRFLVARGSEKQLAVAADVVRMLEHPADKPVPKIKHLFAFRFKFAHGGEVAGALKRLGFQSQIASTEETVFVLGSEQELKEIGEVIEQLDVEIRQTKPEKRPEGGTALGKGGGN
jgi:beta-lactamase regulating signal transducer with metallopeptidase domain